MKALLVEKLGKPEDVLAIKIIDPPFLPPNCVKIRVIAASLNFADSLIIQGQYQERPKLPYVPGNECSGVIAEVGRDVINLKPGDLVCAVTQQGGAFAQEAIAQASSTIKLGTSASIPTSTSMEQIEAAAGLPVAFGTAYMALTTYANLHSSRAGQQHDQKTVLVLGAAGGVGLAAVQIATVLGARVVAVARGSTKISTIRQCCPSAICIDMNDISQHQHSTTTTTTTSTSNVNVHSGIELTAAIKKNVGGVDVLFDPVGGALFTAAFKTLNWGGTVLLVGFASGKLPPIPSNICLVKNVRVQGVYWGSHAQGHGSDRSVEFRKSLDAVGKLFMEGRVTVHVSHRYSLEQAKEAFSVLTKRQVVGKLLFLPSGQRSML